MSRGVVAGMVVVVILIIAIAAVVINNLGTHNTAPVVDSSQKAKKTASGLLCPQGSEAILAQTLESTDEEYCTCEDDEYAAELCSITLTDALLYQNAISQLDERLCEDIAVLSRKDACVTLVQNNLATTDATIIAEIRLQNNDLRSIDSYEKILAENPEDVETLLSLAFTNAEAGLREQEHGGNQVPFVEKALTYIAEAKNLDAGSARVYEVEGYAYEILPDIDLAFASYNQAIKINPQSIDAYVGRGHAANLQGYLDAALNDFLKAKSIDVNQKHPAVYAHLCRLQSTRSDMYDEAKNNCLVLLSIEQAGALNKSEAYQILANIARQQGDIEKVVKYHKEAQLLTPNDPNLLTALADYEIGQKNYKEAEAYARDAIEVAAAKAVPYLSLSYSLYQQERFAEAIVEADKGVSLIDGDVSLLVSSKDAFRREFYYTLANIYFYTGEKEKELEYKALGDKLAI